MSNKILKNALLTSTALVAGSMLFAGAGVGSIYGGILLAMGLGGAAGSWIAGLLHDLTGGYGAGFLVAVLGAAAGIVLFRIQSSPE